MAAKTASVGVDVDSLCHYYRIHGLDEDAASNAAWEIGVPRFVTLFESVGIPATFYCIAEDLEIKDNATRIRDLAERGFEIGNHSFHHRYTLSRLPEAEMYDEVATAKTLLEASSGVPVVGFRAPGYNTNASLASAVFRSGHSYDSSVFPCAPYYLAKAGVMGLMYLGGRRSRSILGDVGVLRAPADPYTMSSRDPHRPSASGGLQYPISVALGVPMLGTAFTAMGYRASTSAAALALRLRRHVTLEFHALDLLGLREDSLDPVLAAQPDLRVSVDSKEKIFRGVLERVAKGARVERMDVLASEFGVTQ